MMTMEPETIDTQETKESLIEQIKQKHSEREDAFQKQKTDEVPIRQQAGTSEQVGEGDEEEEVADHSEQEEKGKSFKFALGDEIFDVDENATFDLKADGKTVSMTLKEMRDAAAGGVAVRNRMRQLAEEKKKLHEPYKNFKKIAEKDPLVALKKVFSVIKKIEPDADLNEFLVGLGKQAQSLSQMSPSERKAYHLEKELDEAKTTLTESERLAKVQEMKQELTEDYGLSEEEVYLYGQQILENPVLAESIKNEKDLFDRIGDLADEVHRQQAVLSALHKYEPNIKKNDPLVFELSSLLEKNPDFDESDLEEIAEGVLRGVKKSKISSVLSKRQRSSAVKGFQKRGSQTDLSKMPSKDALKLQILEKKKGQQTKR